MDECSTKGTNVQVTVGMPVWNGERFLRQAIEAILGQTFSNFELLISDNASDDRTADICQYYVALDPRVKYHRQSTNLGPSANFRWLVAQASTPFFMWAASDDYLDPHWIETLLASSKESVALVCGAIDDIKEDGQVVRRMMFPSLSGGAAKRLTRLLLWPEQSGKCCIIYGLFRREALAHSLPVFTDWPASDLLVTFDVLRRGEFVGVDGVTLHKRVRSHDSPAPCPRRNPGYLARRLFCVDELLYLSKYTILANSLTSGFGLCALLTAKYCVVLTTTNGNRLRLLITGSKPNTTAFPARRK